MSQRTPIQALAAVGLLIIAGCQQNSAGQARFPWTVNSPAAPADGFGGIAAGNPAGMAGAAGNPSPGVFGRLLQRRNGYVADLQYRANEQSRLAEEQQRRLAQLRELQRLNDQQLAQLRLQQQQARDAAIERRTQRDRQLAERARTAIDQYQEMDKRARGLDRNNADLHTRLAKTHQQNQLLEDQNHLLRRRLEDTAKQLADAIETTKSEQQRLQTMMASARRRSGASITANNSYRRNLTAVTVPGLTVRQDGELVRIELPADQIFETGTARLCSAAVATLEQVSGILLEHYPRQVVGVEAHTDNRPLSDTLWRNSHQLTAAQAMSVFEHLGRSHRLLPQQMFVLGHGHNYPLASNATSAGQARNRRVEIVIYPEQVGDRS